MTENISSAPEKTYATPIGTAYTYKTIESRDLKIYVATPPNWSAAEKRPATVFFHGGGWTKGAPSVLNDQAAHYTAKGMVCFLAEYRLIPRSGAETPDICMRDAKSAMRWVRANAADFGVDPKRIAAGGGSAGAHLAACTALIDGFDEATDNLDISPRPQALVLFNPVIDTGPGGFAHHRTGDRYMQYSPLHNIRPGAPPTIILSGSEDRVVPVSTAYAYRDAMEQSGARCDVHIYPGQAHGFYRKSESGGEYFSLTLREIDAFFVSLGWLP